MKALVRYAKEADSLALREMPEPAPGPGQIKLKVAACGICGIDAHHRRLTFDSLPKPYTIGHEFSGTVVELGEGVDGFEIGTPVACEPFYKWCGTCEMCRRGQVNNCRKHEDVGFGPDGAMAEYLVIPARGAHKLPESMEVEHGAILEPMSAAYNVMFKDSRTRPGDFVVVLGCGPVGLLCAVHALNAGAEVLLSGWKGDDYRLQQARKIGVQHVVNSADTDVLAKVADLGGSDRPDLIVDAAGGSATFEQALEMAPPCGQVTKIGWFEKAVTDRLDLIIAKNLRVHGVYGQTYDAWEQCIRLIAGGRMPIENLITHDMPLEDWAKGFELAEKKLTVKTILKP